MNDRIDTLAPANAVSKAQVRLVTRDNVSLSATWFLPDPSRESPAVAILVCCGAGIPAKRYHRLAGFLAEHGAAVLTLDYRGIGESRGDGKLRTMRSGMEIWAEFDIGAALEEMKTRFPGIPSGAITHSVGALLVGGAKQAPQLSRLVLLGPHTGYWRDYGRRWRPLMYLSWHVFMPAATRLAGYFPGRALKLGEDLPPRIAMDWAERRQPALVKSGASQNRFGALLQRFREMRAQTLAISITDDAFAPPDAAHRLLAVYPGLRVTHRIVSPALLGCQRLGHFGFLRRPSCESIWRQAAEWLIPGFPKLQSTEYQECPACEAHQRRKPDNPASPT